MAVSVHVVNLRWWTGSNRRDRRFRRPLHNRIVSRLSMQASIAASAILQPAELPAGVSETTGSGGQGTPLGERARSGEGGQVLREGHSSFKA